MYARGPGGVYFAAAEEPEMHPLIQMGSSLAPFGIVGGVGYGLMSTKYKSSKEISYFDIVQRGIRNFADIRNVGPIPIFGFFNTLRYAERASSFLSPAAMGLSKGASLLDNTKTVHSYVMDGSFFKNSDSKNLLKEIIGEDNFSKISDHMIGGNEDFRFTVEFDDNKHSKGKLIFQKLEDAIETDAYGNKTAVKRAVTGSEKDLGRIRLTTGAYSADYLDYVDKSTRRKGINPLAQGIYQNLDSSVNLNNVFKSTTERMVGNEVVREEDILKYVPVPTVTGDLKTLGDLRRRTALLFGYQSMSVNRFNKLLSATFNQIPLVGSAIEKAMDKTGLSLKTKPGPFYKQFFNIGLKATKIGAAYMGLETVDHYRRNYGVLGNLVASSAVGFGTGYLYNKFAQDKSVLKAGKIGAGVAAFQMLMPGFDKGIVEGIASTAVNFDIGRSFVGKYSGLSYYRRGIEGLLPGSTDYTFGLGLGLGAAALSYMDYPKGFMKRAVAGKQRGLDKVFGSTMDFFLRDPIKQRIGFLSEDSLFEKMLTKKQVEARTIFSMLSTGTNNGDFSEEFNKFNPLAEKLKKLGSSNPLVQEYEEELLKITRGKTSVEFTDNQIKQLKNFFNDREDLFNKILFDGNEIDEGISRIKLQDFAYASRKKVHSELDRIALNENKLNLSLLNRIEEINSRYTKSGFLNNILRRTEIFGAEIYHSFFGATLQGNITRTVDGEVVTESYDKIAKSLNASPIFRRFGSIVFGVTAIHQLLTTGLFGAMEDPDELKQIYSGEKYVEIKEGRFWEAGGTPLEGGKTKYFRPHAYNTLMTQAKERSVWGDDVERFNPITRFFLKNFTYYLEEKNYYDRPYPVTSAAFKDLPVIGDLLASTIGQVIKAPKLMHHNEISRLNEEGGTVYAYQREFGSPENSSLQSLNQVPISPYSTTSVLAGNLQYQAREISGLPGFVSQTLQDVITGSKYMGTEGLQMAESADMYSTRMNFWEMDLGGMAFMSEPIRRLLPRERSEIEKYNPILNSMPSYIPGRFKHGDPYRLIPNGYARLPGKGYEALNPDVKGLDPEDYPDIHKYKILADIAPKSRDVFLLKQKLFERRAAGITTEHENKLMDRIDFMHQKVLAGIDDDPFHEKAIKTPFISDIVAPAYLGATERLRQVAAPVEHLIPFGFRPVSKLLGSTKSAIETYEYERMYGTANAFWDKPWRDWFRPSIYTAAHMVGWDGKPMHVQQREELNENFDKLQFLKFMKLAQEAEAAGNLKDKERYLNLASNTRVGVNPNGDAMSIYMSLPNSEKAFFDAFSKAQGEDRQRILEMVPEDQKHLYEAVWSRIDSGDVLSLYSGSKSQVDLERMNQQMHGLAGYFEGKPIPRADWIGWNKDVDLEDIKIKYVEDSFAGDIHDYDMYESQVRRISRKPYLEDSALFMYESPVGGRDNIRDALTYGYQNIPKNLFESSIINYSYNAFEPSRAQLYYNDTRTEELAYLINSALGG